MSNPLREKIESTVKENPVVIYMKGDQNAPQCGFSARAVEVLRTLGKPIVSVNVLADEALWGELEKFTNWPTVPQVFIKGQFIGGCDIVTEMHERGELKKMVD